MINNLVVKFKCFLKPGESLEWSTSSDGMNIVILGVDKKGGDKSIIVMDSATIKGFLRNVAQIY